MIRFSEWAIIDTIKKRFQQKGNILSLYDDAWGCRLKKKYLVSSGDMLVETTDVPPFMTVRQMATKSFTMSVSDLASKGVEPTYYYLVIGLHKGFGWRRFRELIKGWEHAVKLYGGHIMGGDTNEAQCLTISVIAISLSNTHPIPRLGGRSGDIVAVTGLFGDTYVGFKLMRNLQKIPVKLRRRIMEKICSPVARLKEGLALNGVAAACTDSSDGLAVSLHNLIRGTRNGIVVEKIPLADGLENISRIVDTTVFEMVFYGGEEFELVAIIPREKWAEAVMRIERLNGSLIPIGRVVDSKGVWYRDPSGRILSIPMRGWVHLSS